TAHGRVARFEDRPRHRGRPQMRRAARLVERPALGQLVAVRGEMIVTVDEPWQEREPRRVDGLAGARAAAARARRHSLAPTVLERHDRVAHGRCPGPVDQRPDPDDRHHAPPAGLPAEVAYRTPARLDSRASGAYQPCIPRRSTRKQEDSMRATSQLRQLLKSGKPLFVPGCYNALSARIVAEVGFPAIYMTGYGTSLSLLGLPDAGLATMTEMHLNARYIAGAVSVPVIADADNGYGNAINVMRTVRDYIGTGVAGIHIADQAIPQRRGHVAGRRVIPIEEAVGKSRAADAVRRELDPDFVLIARTDARGAAGGSLDDAIRRANAYLEAGADLAFVEGPTSADEVRRICREVKGPVFYNQTRVSPRVSLAQMHALPVPVTILPGATFRATIEAVYNLAVALRDEGPLAEERFAREFAKHPLGDLHTFAGFDRIRQWEAQYLPPEELEKYAGSIGHQPTRA